MKAITTFIIGIVVFSLSGQQKAFGEKLVTTQPLKTTTNNNVSTELHGISEIKSVLELSDVGFYPELVNEPLNALDYEGNRKIAANTGAYLADFIYTKNTTEGELAYNNYGAIMELSKKLGINEDVTALMVERYDYDNNSAEEIQASLQEALKNSDKNFSETKTAQLYAYLVTGNYIEKLYLTSNIILRPKQTSLPQEAEVALKRNLLKYVSEQSTQLQEVIDLFSVYYGDINDQQLQSEIIELMNSYQKIEAQRTEILSLSPAEIAQREEVIDILNRIENIRNRIIA